MGQPRYSQAIALVVACTFSAAMLAAPARAHRLESAMTTIESNIRTGNLEIVHEINYHDLEHVVSQIKGRAIDLTRNKQALVEAVEWLTADFRLTYSASKKPIDLQRVGAEIDQGRLLIYYEGKRPKELGSLRVFDQMLMESIPHQVNRVQIRIDGPTQTLIFRQGDDWKELLISNSEDD